MPSPFQTGRMLIFPFLCFLHQVTSAPSQSRPVLHAVINARITSSRGFAPVCFPWAVLENVRVEGASHSESCKIPNGWQLECPFPFPLLAKTQSPQHLSICIPSSFHNGRFLCVQMFKSTMAHLLKGILIDKDMMA